MFERPETLVNYAYATSKDRTGKFVIDTANNPTGNPNGFGWKPAAGSGASISGNYYGRTPVQKP
jgi:hypothetical protein